MIVHIDATLQIVKKNTFENEFPVILQPNMAAQLHNVMECYNITAEEEEDPRNIDIA